MAPAAPGFVPADLADSRDTFLSPGLLPEGMDHAPPGGIMFAQQVGHRGHRHLAGKDHEEDFQEPGQAAVGPGPRQLDGFDPPRAWALDSGHAGIEGGRVWEEVQMP